MTGIRSWTREVHDLDPQLRRAAEAAQRDRGDSDGKGGDGREQTRYSPPADVRGVVKSWSREMTIKYHPDRTLDDGAASAPAIFVVLRLPQMRNRKKGQGEAS